MIICSVSHYKKSKLNSTMAEIRNEAAREKREKKKTKIHMRTDIMVIVYQTCWFTIQQLTHVLPPYMFLCLAASQQIL